MNFESNWLRREPDEVIAQHRVKNDLQPRQLPERTRARSE